MKTIIIAGMVALTALAEQTRAAEGGTSGKSVTKAVEKSPAPLSVPRSFFHVPNNPSEGRDPFFPNSTRLAFSTAVTNAPQESAVVNLPLTLQGISGAPGHRLAIINGRTLAENEEAEVTSGTVRQTVRCIEIRTDSVVIEVANTRRELRLRSSL